ncbi:SAV_915 family protein [Nocardioides sp. 31GB23]|uniref:SAV_915 family protein n=1 Tax=Nocardioides sp. 31GB23 TaxID=3156065 RepID=UPI0032AF8CE4
MSTPPDEPARPTGRAPLQPPVAYLPCRLDDEGNLAEVMMVELADGRVALMGYTALDRFARACGEGHPWVLWQTSALESLRELKHYDVAYLDVPLPVALRVPAAEGTA